MKENNKSVLYNLAKIRAEVRTEANKENFKTYKKAIEEIGRLQDEIYRVRLANALLTHKKTRGRPRKRPNGSIFDKLQTSNIEKKKGGRPAKLTIEKMREEINGWDSDRIARANEMGKKSLSDMQAILIVVNKSKADLTAKERTIVNNFHKKIGYFRDQTGVRIRTNIKRKTPAKKT